jgi:hypothetical protein
VGEIVSHVAKHDQLTPCLVRNATSSQKVNQLPDFQIDCPLNSAVGSFDRELDKSTYLWHQSRSLFFDERIQDSDLPFPDAPTNGIHVSISEQGCRVDPLLALQSLDYPAIPRRAFNATGGPATFRGVFDKQRVGVGQEIDAEGCQTCAELGVRTTEFRGHGKSDLAERRDCFKTVVERDE